MQFVTVSRVIDDEGNVMGEQELSTHMPPTTDIQSQHMILGEGQMNLAELAKQAAIHAVWVAARDLVGKIEAQEYGSPAVELVPEPAPVPPE